jgi:hypothetical protein
MKILYVDTYVHHKNKIGFLLMCKSKGIECVLSRERHEFLKEWDLVFIPSEYVPPSFFPYAKCIMYGPQNFVFANGPWYKGHSFFPPNCFYNLLSDWVIDVQDEMGGMALPAKALPFAVDVETFKPLNLPKEYDCFVYFKQRHSSELSYVVEELNRRKLTYKLITYGSYKEEEYIDTLHKSKFGIWIGRHESQGFGLEEALSCNVPLLVWDCTSMFQEYNNDTMIYKEHLGSKKLLATAKPYWDSTCGLSFTEKQDFSALLTKMMETYSTYQPREYVLKTLSPDACMNRLLWEVTPDYMKHEE